MTAGGVILAFALVAANGFFVAVEFGIARLRPTQAAEFAREGRPGSKSVLHAVDHIDSYLSACQLGITICSLGLGALGEPAFQAALEPLLGDAAEIAGIGVASALAFAIITTLHVVVGELAPKSAAIARTLALSPDVVLFDEPTTGLDPVSARRVDRLIRELAEKLGVTAIVVSHDPPSIFGVADRVAFLYQGVVHAVATPAELRASPDPIVQQFITGQSSGPMETPGF